MLLANWTVNKDIKKKKTPKKLEIINCIIFWYFTKLSQVKQFAIITYEHGIYEFPHELANDLELRDLRKLRNIRRVLQPHGIIA